MTKTIAGAILAYVLAYGPAQAQSQLQSYFTTGNDLYEWCNDKRGEVACLNYVSGVSDAVEAMQFGQSNRMVCKPVAAVTVRQIRDVVMGYMSRHPEERHESAGSIALVALAEAWPCVRRKE